MNEYVKTAYSPIEKFIIIGLTGRRGSGCSTAREHLCNEKGSFDAHGLIHEMHGRDTALDCHKIDFETLKNFAIENEVFPFEVIRVRDILTTFVMDNHAIFFTMLQNVYPKHCDDARPFEAEAFQEKFLKQFKITFDDMCKKSKDIWDEIDKDVYAYINRMKKDDYEFLTREIVNVSGFIREFLKKNLGEDAFTLTYQHIGNLVRKYGELRDSNNWKNHKPEYIYKIIERINLLIKIMRRKEWIMSDINERSNKPTQNHLHLVIDSIKNEYEAYYMKARYGSFYLMGITLDDRERKARLRYEGLSEDQIMIIDHREQPSLGQKAYMEGKKENEKNSYCDYLASEKNCNNDFAKFMIDAYKTEDYKFYLQDVDYCIQNADILINNAGKKEELKKPLLRYVCLMFHPGLVPPTVDERNMQIAQAAKLNSGCISRQVGAVVCDKYGSILSVGWNDPSAHEGNEYFSCIRRNFSDLWNKKFKYAYSCYELDDPEFRKRMVEVIKANSDKQAIESISQEQISESEKYEKLYAQFMADNNEKLKGLPTSYCFKDVYNAIKGDRNQVHTRAQHGEEKAMEGCDKSRTAGGTLYSTSSSCELCAKKALSYNIERIVFIEPYSGLTNDHILGHNIKPKHGEEMVAEDQKQKQVQVELFTGATQCAYSQLYTPIFPLKDELELRGVKLK